MEVVQKVFAREGFYGATIKKIAIAAGLKSPSLVYWYFEHKKYDNNGGQYEAH